MRYTIFEKKVIEKWNKELLELHKRCCKTYLIQRSVHIARIKQFFIIYDKYIDPSNINQFFDRPIHIFVQALVLNQLHQISNYIPKYGKSKKKRSSRVHKR